jgi:putative nucleotidyltransferase with HDIG domain
MSLSHIQQSNSEKLILLVDDDESLRPVLERVLVKEGYKVLSAQNGKIGQDLFNAHPVDLVISDIRMPEMDGIELTKFIKATRSVPVILITGFSDILETQTAHALGADEFIPKPFQRESIIAATERCFGVKEQHTSTQDQSGAFCRLAIDDFISGHQIQFGIFIKLSDVKYVKIAHHGEDLPIDRITTYKNKGVHYLYLSLDDFRKYVGFNVSLTRAVRGNRQVSLNKRRQLAKHTGEVIQEQINHDGLDPNLFDGAVVFVKTVVDLVTEDPNIYDLLDNLSSHTDYLYAHSVGVSMYGVLLAQTVGWHLPTNKFKVGVGGLLHDIGQKEISKDLLMKPRVAWSFDDVQTYEQHASRGVEIVREVNTIPNDVVQIVKEHHENCLGQGFPSRIKKTLIHPMAKLIAVVDEFCELVVPNPNCAGMPPAKAVQQMLSLNTEQLDPAFFQALMHLCKVPIPEQMKDARKV